MRKLSHLLFSRWWARKPRLLSLGGERKKNRVRYFYPFLRRSPTETPRIGEAKHVYENTRHLAKPGILMLVWLCQYEESHTFTIKRKWITFFFWQIHQLFLKSLAVGKLSRITLKKSETVHYWQSTWRFRSSIRRETTHIHLFQQQMIFWQAALKEKAFSWNYLLTIMATK